MQNYLTAVYPLIALPFSLLPLVFPLCRNDHLPTEAQQQKLWINPQDAQNRGIAQGDTVRIHNARGICEIPAEVTPRIIPGVVAMQAGAWWQPDEQGIDKGGCANVLSSARITALAKGNSHQTMLVEVAKA